MAVSSIQHALPAPTLLNAQEDEYDGVKVEINDTNDDVDKFTSSLQASISHWKTQGKKGVWIKVPLPQAKLVPTLVENGFWYHHAEPTYVMLVYWIPQTSCTLPTNASYRVGVGAFVFNDKGEVLAVQERNGPYKGSGLWKMPTGWISQDQEEDIRSGAIREVKEETGIESEFLEIVGFRHGHNARFGKSDLHFVCMMKSSSSVITKQDTEISAAKWMGIKEFVSQRKNQESKLLKEILRVCVARHEQRYKGFSAVEIPSSSSGKRSSVFFRHTESN